MPVVDEEIKQQIIRQVEYYFSTENLFKDVFLRKKMDTQGFVPLQILVQFHRLNVISGDVNTVLTSLLASNEVEVLYNSERGPLVRARQDPTKWVYPIDERDESARHPGPATMFFQTHQETLRQMQEYQQYPYTQPYYFDSQYGGFPGGPFSRPHDHESSPPHVSDPAHSPVSPHFDLQNRKLSGEASPFVPNGVNYGPPMVNGDSSAYVFPTVTEESEEPVNTLDEDNLATLVVIVHDNTGKSVPPALPVNGVNHKVESADDSQRTPLQPVTWRIPGITAPNSPGSPRTEKNPQKQRSQTGEREQLYPEFLQSALKSRESHLKSSKETQQMVHLYQFWSDFLRDYWVPSMYTEFLNYAVDDANNTRRSGLVQLFSMYERVLETKFRPSLWNDFVRLAGEDYRNGQLAGIERVWRIRGKLFSQGRMVKILDGDVFRLVDMEIKQAADLDRLRQEVKPAGVVLVPYTIVSSSPTVLTQQGQSV
jgi:hypothetical protein